MKREETHFEYRINPCFNSKLCRNRVYKTDSYTIQANRDYLADIPAKNSNGSVNAIIEIPTGSNQKWEVSKQDSSTLHWEFKNGQPRIVKYQAVAHYQKSNQSS
ncbi:hypothetical protein ACPV3S_02610 [Photobacterium damselae]|uniref:hypothetical protein n=1 Tax=Photobacterium damselae TaxID=38293 RepID=UPI0040689197